MNLAGFRTALDQRTGVGYDTSAADTLINEGLMAISAEFNWPWQQRTWTFTTNGATGYNLPFDNCQVRYVTVAGDEYHRVDIVDFDVTPVLWGQWGVWGDQLILPAMTGSAVVARYHADEQPLEKDTDEPFLPDQYSGAVVEFAAARVFDRAGSGDTRAAYLMAALRANGAEKKYQDWLRRMRRNESRQAGPRAARVRQGYML